MMSNVDQENGRVQESVMTKEVFKKTFWRTFPLQACFCYERMQNVGFAYQMVPALKKLYPDKEEASKALKRHLAIFNTTPCVVPFITGASIAMEEKFKKARENGEECDEESINAVKTALMGPLAGIGDSFFWGTLRIIAAGIGFFRNYPYHSSFAYISFAAKSALLHLPYIVRFTIFNLLFVPSTKPFESSLATEFSTASISFSNPFANRDISFKSEFL